MKCPVDGTILQRVSMLGVDLDKCHKCDGIWCDKGEMERLRDSKRDDIEEVIEGKYGDPTYVEEQTDGYMQCPRCDGRLLRRNYSYGNPVTVDLCEKCYGVWLDDGELNKIVEEKTTMEQELPESKLRQFLSAIAASVKK